MSYSSLLGFEQLPQGGFLLVPDLLQIEDIENLKKIFTDRQIILVSDSQTPLAANLATALDSTNLEHLSFELKQENIAQIQQDLTPHLDQGAILLFLPQASKQREIARPNIAGETLVFLEQLAHTIVPLAIDRPNIANVSIRPKDNELCYSFGKAKTNNCPKGTLLQNLLIAGEAAFQERSFLQESLGWALIHGLKTHGKNILHDSIDGSETSYEKLLAAALVFAQTLRQQTDKERIAIILPPGRAGMLANLAVVFAGKVPVNLNFTAGSAAIESAIKQSGADRFITADKFIRKNQTFPWPPNKQIILVERTLPQLKGKITQQYLLNKLLPASWIAKMAQIPQQGGENEAVLLFTSGSSGAPKGVALTHRNILGNVTQISSFLDLEGNKDRILGSLPLFHSFGATVTLWYPIIQGLGLVTHPSPMDVAKLAELCEKTACALLVTTPTFLRGYLKRAQPKQLASLKLLVTGAEKLPTSLAQAFEEKFGKPVLEGYGLTETSPVTNVNLPQLTATEEFPIVLPSHRPGSVGQLMPGLAVKITDPNDETNQAQSIFEQGMIWLKGINVFSGYLNNKAKTKEVIKDGWFRTGDIGRLDADGFLYIEGRLSRFSKIGGEMVPHERVEEEICKALGLNREEERKIVVVGIPDEDKGEMLVLLSTVAGETISQELIDLRYRLLEVGIPSLWIPKRMLPVREIPILANGKLDIQSCLEIAQL